MNKIELLNSEGTILSAVKHNSDKFDIIDQYNILVGELNAKEIQEFIHGNSEIIDSKNKSFKYSSFPGTMKPDLKLLDEFIGIDTSNKVY